MTTEIWLDDCVTILDDAERFQWRRTRRDDRFMLDGVWPSAAERESVEHCLSCGGRLLVVAPATAHATSAFRDELPVSLTEASKDVAAVGDDDLVEVSIAALDWLPKELGDRGRSALEELAERWYTTPEICRAAITFAQLTPTVSLAFRAPGVRSDEVRSQVMHLASWVFQERR